MSASSSSDGSLPSSASSSASAHPALLPASSATHAVTVEDESTKRCSVCAEDRPVSAFSSAQLKKKGKRVCHSCVSKRDALAGAQQQAANTAAAATRKEAMKDAFAVRLNSTPTQTATACLCCHSKAAVRFAPCIRCTVDCCSLKCFDRHDCDAYLEAKRTMPTELIPEEDRFGGEEDFLRGWKEVFDHALGMPASVSALAVQGCVGSIDQLRVADGEMAHFTVDLCHRLHDFYSPHVTQPWWNPALCARLNYEPRMPGGVHLLKYLIANAVERPSFILEQCAGFAMVKDREVHIAELRGSCVPDPRIDIRSICFLPGRLFHKLLTLLRFVVRAMDSAWVQAYFVLPGDLSKDAFGVFPTAAPAQGGKQVHLGYLELPAPDIGRRTMVPLVGTASALSKFCSLRHFLGQQALSMVLLDGQLQFDRGLFLLTKQDCIVVNAMSGWTGNAMDSFSTLPTRSLYFSDQWLLRDASDSSLEEIAARKRSDYFHLVLAIKQMIPEDEWPNTPGSGLFIATPQLGVESEFVELSLLESLVEDAAAGNEQSQLLLSHIECECARPISDVISAQKSRLDQMLEDQAAQLRIHAEAVKRAEMRGRLTGAADDSAEGPPAPASVSSPSVSALAPTSAASSSSSAVSTASASSSLPGPAYSWTQSREYAGLESLREPGRKKYSTIMSAAKRLLYSLRPVSVNKKGGSHIVFHFASGAPATLVQMHAGGRSKDSTAHTTRLFAQLSEVAMQQMGGAIEGAPMHAAASAGAAVGRLLQ